MNYLKLFVLMLDEALNENFPFAEINNKRDDLKKYGKEFNKAFKTTNFKGEYL